MGYRWRNDPLTGEPILMNDAEARDDSNAATFSFMIIIMLVFSQLMLQDGTSLFIRMPLGIFSVIVGAILASNMFGVVMGFVLMVAAIAFLPGGTDAAGFKYIYWSGVLGAIINVAISGFSMMSGPPAAEQAQPLTEDEEIQRKRQERAQRRGEVYKPPVEAVGFKALSKHENQAPKKRRKKKEPFIGNSE